MIILNLFDYEKAVNRMTSSKTHLYLLFGGYYILFCGICRTGAFRPLIHSSTNYYFNEKEIDYFIHIYHYIVGTKTNRYLEEYATVYNIKRKYNEYESLEEFQKDHSEESFMYLPEDYIILLYDILVFFYALKVLSFKLKQYNIAFKKKDFVLPNDFFQIHILSSFLFDLNMIDVPSLLDVFTKDLDFDSKTVSKNLSNIFVETTDASLLELNWSSL